ncbi:MAG: hypothetical protein SGPRY_001406 [Prymnesium sp.]
MHVSYRFETPARALMEGSSFRCWICLEDQPSTHAMLSACDCVGTNRFVHESCLNTYCLRTLADNEHRQHDLDVCCPICRGKYVIEREASSVASWRELVRCTSTDWQLLLRHCRFFLLILPLLVTSTLSWCWLYAYWDDLYRNGSGPPLLAGDRPVAPVTDAAFTWLPSQISAMISGGLDAIFAQRRLEDTRATDGLAKEPHPSQISHNWSLLYVWLQYARSYMILSWVMMMLLGDIEGLLPSSARELFRIEELVLVRHGIVAAFSSIAIVRYIVFNVFTSHTEVALLVSSDTIARRDIRPGEINRIQDCMINLLYSLVQSSGSFHPVLMKAALVATDAEMAQTSNAEASSSPG